MPWLTIIMWVVSYLMSYSKTGDAGKSALIATGVAAATYYTLEPTNESAVFGDTTRSWLGYEPVDPSTAINTQDAGLDPSAATTATGFGATAIKEVGSTARSWGPVGTMGVIAGTAALTGNAPSWLMPAAIGVGAIILLK